MKKIAIDNICLQIAHSDSFHFPGVEGQITPGQYLGRKYKHEQAGLNWIESLLSQLVFFPGCLSLSYVFPIQVLTLGIIKVHLNLSLFRYQMESLFGKAFHYTSLLFRVIFLYFTFIHFSLHHYSIDSSLGPSHAHLFYLLSPCLNIC